MKPMVLLTLFLTTSVFALSGRDLWKHSNTQRRVYLLGEYFQFLQQYHENERLGPNRDEISFLKLLLSDAWAAELDCLYAGWPSKRVGKYCSSPAKHNPDYQSSCSQQEMLCQPLLFGQGVCVPSRTSQERNLAFSNCSKKKSFSNEDLVKNIN